MLQSNKYTELYVGDIYYDPTLNCRSEFLPQSCLELSESIREHGLLFPIVVQPIEDVEFIPPAGYKYRLLAGHRRFIATTRLLSREKILSCIMSGLSAKDARIVNAVENVERKNLNLFEEGVALRSIFPNGASYREMGLAFSKGQDWCRIRWRIMELPEELQKDCAAGRLHPTDIALILGRKDDESRIALANVIKRAIAQGDSARRRQERFAKTKRARTRTAIQTMMAHLMTEEIAACPLLALAWASGQLTDKAFLEAPL